jgi:ribosomal-protein-alanine N-acetyltransferase
MALLLPDRLQTLRLILRRPRQTDAAIFFDAYAQDIEVARHMTWRPHKAVSETEEFISSCIEGWDSGRSRPYVLAAHDSEDIPIGMLEARLQSRTIDIGYVLGRSYWGSGLMPEAVRALSDSALAMPQWFRVQATCDVENQASARTLEKSGLVREARLERYTVHPNVSAEPRPCFMYARCR